MWREACNELTIVVLCPWSECTAATGEIRCTVNALFGVSAAHVRSTL